MKKIIRSKILWGILLILAGLVAFLGNIGFLGSNQIIWIILSFLGAGFFFSFLIENKRNWWALIPGVSLLGIGLVYIAGWISPAFEQEWGETFIFIGIAMSFLAVFIYDTSQWWAILPTGVLFSFGAVSGLDRFFNERDSAALFMLGLGVTFMVLAILPNKAGRMAWAWFPALVLMITGTIIMVTAGQLIGYIGSFLIIAMGIILIIHAVRRV